MRYDPQNWFWIVGGDTKNAYSSSAAKYVTQKSAAYKAFTEAGGVATQIDSEESLQDVFAAQYPSGWPSIGIKAQLEALDAQLPRALENFWEVSGFETKKLNAKQLAILQQKQTLRAQLSS